LDMLGNVQTREVTGKVVDDTLVLTPALPAPPPGAGMVPGGPGAPPGPPPGGPDGRQGGGFQIKPIMASRGAATPSNRAPAVDYSKLPQVVLPAVKPVPSNGLAKTPPMGWNSGIGCKPTSTTRQSAPSTTPW
jgi:hypothetical protein